METSLPAGFTLRPATFDDLPSVLRLIIERNLADFGEPMGTADRLRQKWEALDLAQDTWLALAPDGRAAGYAELERPQPGARDFRFYADPNYPSLPAHLLACIEQRARATRTQTLMSRASERNALGLNALRAAGYVSDLSFLIMELVMDAPPSSPQWASGFSVRPFAVGQDEQATYQTDEEASIDKGYHRPLTFDEWAQRMSLHGKLFDPGLWFLAWQGSDLSGVALNFYAAETDTGWIDHLSVRRPWRKQGLGLALLQHSFGEFYRRGVRRIRLSVDSQSLTNAPRLYERAGMGTVQQYHIFSKDLALGSG